MIGSPTPTSVSYTHLDVYKRQSLAPHRSRFVVKGIARSTTRKLSAAAAAATAPQMFCSSPWPLTLDNHAKWPILSFQMCIRDRHPAVAAWVKNDRLGLVIPYRKEGTPRKYLPDFIVELESGGHLIVEIKGQVGDALIKKAAAERWCRAVSNDSRFGAWRYALCFGTLELKGKLDSLLHAEQSVSA